MSDWIHYDNIVDLVMNHHHNTFSGLITGVSDSKHSFQIGFHHGEIILLTYSIKKNLQALPLIAQIQRAKIAEHPGTEIRGTAGDAIDTNAVLSQLTASMLAETTTMETDVSEISELRARDSETDARPFDTNLRKSIEAAAIHHFGPIGAMLSEEHLRDQKGDVRTIVLAIARDVGASDIDTQAFFKSVFEL